MSYVVKIEKGYIEMKFLFNSFETAANFVKVALVHYREDEHGCITVTIEAATNDEASGDDF